MKVKLLSRVQLFATPWTVAHQAPLSMGFSKQEYWLSIIVSEWKRKQGHHPKPTVRFQRLVYEEGKRNGLTRCHNRQHLNGHDFKVSQLALSYFLSCCQLHESGYGRMENWSNQGWTMKIQWSEVAQSCPTLCDSMDCSLPGSSVHKILYTRILKWVGMPSSRGSSQPRDQACMSYISYIGRRVLHY